MCMPMSIMVYRIDKVEKCMRIIPTQDASSPTCTLNFSRVYALRIFHKFLAAVDR